MEKLVRKERYNKDEEEEWKRSDCD